MYIMMHIGSILMYVVVGNRAHERFNNKKKLWTLFRVMMMKGSLRMKIPVTPEKSDNKLDHALLHILLVLVLNKLIHK